jgi:hypothetical protein
MVLSLNSSRVGWVVALGAILTPVDDRRPALGSEIHHPKAFQTQIYSNITRSTLPIITHVNRVRSIAINTLPALVRVLRIHVHAVLHDILLVKFEVKRLCVYIRVS